MASWLYKESRIHYGTKKIAREEIYKALHVIIEAVKTEEGKKLIAETGITVEFFEIENDFTNGGGQVN